MCGIAGILGRLDQTNRAALARMSQALAHRGPDDAGTWESAPDAAGRGALLTFRRLAILDLSPAGSQPMVEPASGRVLILNGEIYNYQELRRWLVARGETIRSTGDAEVLLRMLARRGAEALPELRGMFALASWDPARRTLLLARDSLGIKPLYLAARSDASSGWTLAFASELRALLASGLLGTPRLDRTAVASVVWNGFVVGPNTMVEGVELLAAGQARVYDDHGALVSSERFWSMPTGSEGRPAGEEELAVTLEESVRLHLAADVPLAVFLSGGVDSSAVANLARRASQTPVHTFTLAFEEEELNEAPFARKIAAAIGTEHREVPLRQGEFVEHLEQAIDSLDQPTFDGLNAYYLSRAIRQAGFTVALVGTGGDELFGGYESFRALPAFHTWSTRLGFLPRAALVEGAQLALSALNPERGAMPRQSRWAKLPEMIRRGDDLLALYQLAYALFLPDFQADLFPGRPEQVRDGLPLETRRLLEAEMQARSGLATVSLLEQRIFLGERLLRDNDAASMAVSIEQRLPLVDTEVVRTVARLPDGTRYHPVGRKSLLRKVGLRGLDPSLFDRPKRGFVLPFDRWIRQGLSGAIDRTLADPQAVRAVGLRPEPVARLWRGFRDGAPGLYWSRVWALYVLVRWCLRHGVRAE